MVQGTPTDRDRSTFGKFFHDFPDYDVRYTKHAREKMAERGIQAAQIERALRTGSLTEVAPGLGDPLDTVQDIVGGTGGQLAVGEAKRNRVYCAREMLEVLEAPHASGRPASRS